jgi:AcrR family transcriptional regulator
MVLIDRTPAAGSTLRPGPNGLPRTAVADIQRGRIVAAAVQAVEEVGYARMTVAQIIGRARVSRKTFYLVFRDREDCFLAAFDLAIAAATSAAEDGYRHGPTWRARTRSGLASLLAFLDDEPGLAKLGVVEALGAGPPVLQRRAELLERLAAVVDRGRLEATAEPPPLAAEGVVGAVLGVLHARLLSGDGAPLSRLLGPLMGMIVLPYLGVHEAGREVDLTASKLRRPARRPQPKRAERSLDALDIRITYRTARVLMALAELPGASNREIAQRSGIADQGQISKLLTRLARAELITNVGEGQEKGMSNAWHLTDRGARVERATRVR